MPPRKRAEDSSAYQLKVTLRYSSPTIWRRAQVTGDTTFEKLHRILQIVMPWTNSHLHHFILGKNRFVPLDMFDEVEEEDQDEGQVTLRDVAPRPKTKLIYEYDFGDSWEHEIVVEKILPRQPGVHYPICLRGARACPPEDCGGIAGYYNMLQAIQDPQHPEHEDLEEWLGEDFDPQAFDLDKVNRQLRKIR